MKNVCICHNCGEEIMPIITDDEGYKCPCCNATEEELEELE